MSLTHMYLAISRVPCNVKGATLDVNILHRLILSLSRMCASHTPFRCEIGAMNHVHVVNDLPENKKENFSVKFIHINNLLIFILFLQSLWSCLVA